MSVCVYVYYVLCIPCIKPWKNMVVYSSSFSLTLSLKWNIFLEGKERDDKSKTQATKFHILQPPHR